MEVPFIPKAVTAKTETAKPAPVAQKKAAGAYAANKAGSDEITISSKSKLMAKMRASYSDLEKKAADKVVGAKEEVEKHAMEMSAEDIVHGILKGTLFDTI